MARSSKTFTDRRFRIVGIVLLALVVLVLSPAFARFYTDYLWFNSLDLVTVFTRRLTASLGLTASAAAVAIVFLIANWSLLPHWLAPSDEIVRRISVTSRSQRSSEPQEIAISARPLRLLFALAAIGVGFFLGLSFRDLWRTYLLAKEATPFGLLEPIFGRDVGFYVLELPWYEALLGRAQLLLIITLAGVAVRYALFEKLKSRPATAHLSLVGSTWLIIVGLGRLLSRLTLLQSQEGVLFGAGYTDIHARLPLYTVEAVLFFVAAAALIVNLFTRQWKILVGIGLFWMGLSLLGPLYPAIVQQFTVEPNELSLERPYIEHNIRYTREAYQLDKIVEEDFAAEGTLTREMLSTEEELLSNVRLWDYRPLKRTYSQLQEIRLYYSFADVDLDRYQLEDMLTQVMLAARELDVDELPEQAQTWINRHFIFTHGYGMALSSVNQVTPEGLPKLLVRDIPPVSEDPALAIVRPELYFGERTNQYVLVQTDEEEFDYPQGDANVYTRYEGPAGVRMDNPLRRLLFATRFGSTQLLLSSAINHESRVLFHRNIVERARMIAPMLWYDEDPYPVITDDGRIVWLLDAYTYTSHFPYAEPVDNINYIRNSVKVTIDAYTGEVSFYIVDPSDPIIATYARIFPELFEEAAAMPDDLRQHWRYPETLFLYQAQLYATYHMRDPQVFYNREDLWETPQELVETEQQKMEPYYVTMSLPNEEAMEFLLMRPYVPAQKQNMVAWLYARCDDDAYGELGVFKLAKDRLVYGPLQIEGRIDQNPTISQQLSLWNQRGSRVLRGNLLVLPIDDTFLYVEPLYLEAESGQLPELKQVLVAYADRVAMAPTLEEALLQMFAGDEVVGDTSVPPTGDQTLEELAARAWQHYQAAQACLQDADWDCYGTEQSQLEALLRRMADQNSP